MDRLISERDVLDEIAKFIKGEDSVAKLILNINAIPSASCKNCKYWKESDGTFNRGCRAESKCPINTKTVYEGEGYCYMFELNEKDKIERNE